MRAWDGRYGKIHFGGQDVSRVPCMSLDLRGELAPGYPDESCLAAAGLFTRALFEATPNEPPVGEIRILIAGQEVRVVAAPTGRPGVVEMAAEAVVGILSDPEYAAEWARFFNSPLV